MPRIFDNIEQQLLPALAETMQVADRADFCVGYFNLRGWRSIASYVEQWDGGEGHCCRVLVGMQRLPHEELRIARSLSDGQSALDNQTALRLKKRLAEALDEGRLLVLSFFDARICRPTANIAARRNVYVAALADRLLIAHAEKDGKIETLCKEALAEGKPVFALDSPDNAPLVECGVLPVRADDLTLLMAG